MKVCRDCEREYPNDSAHFPLSESKKSLRSYCISCYKEKKARWSKATYTKHREKILAGQREKYRNLNPGQREQLKEVYRRYRLSNLDKVALASTRSRFKKKYGITLDDYNRMELEQDGLCFICSRPPTEGSRLHVDHNHTTGLVRRLLCHRCNTMLGMCGEDVDILNNAINYIQQYQNL